MDKFVIRGGNALLGTVRVSGAKNAALPAMAAALLTPEPVILENIPQVRDIETTRRLLTAMGAEVELGYGRAHHRTSISCKNLSAPEASYDLVKTMRASNLVLGPLVAPDVAAATTLSPHEQAKMEQLRKDSFVGTGPDVMARIVDLKDRVGVDEMAVVTWTHDEEVRRSSYGHLARAMGFAPAV